MLGKLHNIFDGIPLVFGHVISRSNWLMILSKTPHSFICKENASDKIQSDKFIGKYSCFCP